MPQNESPVIQYVQNMSILDINPHVPFDFATWDEADQFLIGCEQNETVTKWLVGKAASELPRAEGDRNFTSWCRRAKLSPGRVNVMKRLWELYDFTNEVQRFPELPYKHWEKLMGRMAEAKRLRKRTGNSESWEQLMDDLAWANDNSKSAEEMMARISKREGTRKDIRDQPLHVQGQIAVFSVNIASSEQDDPCYRTCLVIIPEDSAGGTRWEEWLDERELAGELVDVIAKRVSTE